MAKRNVFFQESLKAMKTVVISKFIRQRVPDCRASVIKSPTAVRGKISRQRGTVRRFRLVDRKRRRRGATSEAG